MDQLFDEIVVNLKLNEISSVCQNLKQLTDKLKSEEFRVSLNADIKYWPIVATIADHICRQIDEQNEELYENINFFELITDLFRVLRNSLISCPSSKRSLVTVGSLLDNICQIFTFLVQCLRKVDSNSDQKSSLKDKQLLIQSIKCCLQVFGNSLSGFDANIHESVVITNHIWNLLSFESFRYLLAFQDESLAVITSMVFFSCLRNFIGENDHNLIESSESQQLFQMFGVLDILLNQIKTESSEWSLWSIQLLLKAKGFLNHFYNHFSDKHKLLILDIMFDVIDKCNDNSVEEKHYLNVSNIEYLTDLFKQNVSDIVKIDSIDPQSDGSDISEANKFIAIHVSKILSVLCQLTVTEDYLHRLQTNKELIECLIDTLKTIQLIGKTGHSSHFETISRLKQMKETEKRDDSLSENPVFGFKRDIIRMIANLVYKCRPMQDWVREMDGIPLVLDCCNIDAKNPYIMQWSIYAIRNLLENNADNQHIVSRLSANGVLIDDELSEKLGFKDGHRSQ